MDIFIRRLLLMKKKNKGIDTHAVANKQTVIGTKVRCRKRKGRFCQPSEL